MKIAYATTYDATRLGGLNEWSGTGHYIAKALIDQSVSIDFVGPLTTPLGFKGAQKFKRTFYKFFDKTNYLADVEPSVLKSHASQVLRKINASSISPDIVFSATVNPIAYLECDVPIAFWADATCAGIVGFYPQYNNLCHESLQNWHKMEKLALEKCALAIYSSDWAAQTAINYYNADSKKVKVVPLGANIDSYKTLDEVKDLIRARSSKQCNLLFLGVDWYRKGGDIAFNVAENLNNLGLHTELRVVGCDPILEKGRMLPSFVKPLGYISKSTIAGQQKLEQLISESHFLILPSRAECYGVVFCESNSFGVPCISQKVGGIPTIIKPNINGNLFNPNSSILEYSNYIIDLFKNYERYENLAFSSYNEYKSRLSWKAAGSNVKRLLEALIK